MHLSGSIGQGPHFLHYRVSAVCVRPEALIDIVITWTQFELVEPSGLFGYSSNGNGPIR